MTSGSDADERTGELIGGRYRLVGRLGSGGFGRVWRAHDTTLGVDVAVKEVWLPPAMSRRDQDERLARAQREARSAARLRDHPNVVGVHDVIVHDDAPWTVMQLVRGRSLDEQVQAHGPLAPQHVVVVARALLKALGAAHAAGIVHRDVKPANVMLSDDGEVLLTDFGIAVQQADTALTATGKFIGSVEYIAPERARGTDGLPGSDLFSLGVTLYQALEGISPFRRDTPTGTLSALLFDEAPPPVRAGSLAPLLTALLEKEPDRRATNAQALALVEQAVTAGLGNGEVAATQVAEVPPTAVSQSADSAGAALPLWHAAAPPVVAAAAPTPIPAAEPTPGPIPAPAAAPVYRVDEQDNGTVVEPTMTATPVPTGGAVDPTVAAAPVPVPRKRRTMVTASLLVVLTALGLVLPTWHNDSTTWSYLRDDGVHSFPLAFLNLLLMAGTVAILGRLATSRNPGLRVAGHVMAWTAAVYWVYRLLSLQEMTGYSWWPLGSLDDHRVGPGVWVLAVAGVALAVLYTRRERATRRVLGVRLSAHGPDRLSPRATTAATAVIFLVTLAAIALPMRERSSASIKTWDYLSGDFSGGVAYQALRVALLLSVLALLAIRLMPRLKPRALRLAGYVLPSTVLVCWSYHLLRLHDSDSVGSYYGNNSFHLGFGAWLMLLASAGTLVLYRVRDLATRTPPDSAA